MIGQENVFWYSHIFIIFKALILYLEHKGRLVFNNRLRLILRTLSKRGKRKLLLKSLYVTVVALAGDPKLSSQKHREGSGRGVLRKENGFWQSLHNILSSTGLHFSLEKVWCFSQCGVSRKRVLLMRSC